MEKQNKKRSTSAIRESENKFTEISSEKYVGRCMKECNPFEDSILFPLSWLFLIILCSFFLHVPLALVALVLAFLAALSSQ